MTHTIVDPTEYEEWNSLITHHASYSFFHSAEWASVLKDSYGYKPLYFAAFDNNKLSATIPMMGIKSYLTGRRGVSLPFSDFCEPIVEDKTQFLKLFDDICQYAKKNNWKYIEIRGGQDYLKDQPSFKTCYTHNLRLQKDSQLILNTFRNSTKRNIKKAEKMGVNIEHHCSYQAVKEFYRLNCITRKDHGIPPQPFYFFKRLYDKVISKNRGVITLAKHKNNYIAGALFLNFGRKAIFKYGASDRNFQSLRPNNMVIWEAIKWHAKKGFEDFSFGITEPRHQGLLQFKRGWGGHEQSIQYYKYIIDSDRFEIAKEDNAQYLSKILKKIPSRLLRAMGFFYKHIG